MKRGEKRRSVRKRRMAAAYQRLAQIFVIILAFTMLVNIIKKNREFSESENRVLAGKPELTWESVKSGRFMSEYETYVSDQFFFRDGWIELKFAQDKLLGKRESNGVYLGKDGYLMEVLDEPDWANSKRNTASIGELAGRYPDVAMSVALIPNAAYILEDKMPSGAPVRDQKKDISRIQKWLGKNVHFFDMTEKLKKHAGEELYYRTDHHWTSLGAYYAFEAMADGMNITHPAEDYNIYTVTEQFQGTLASKSGDHSAYDSIHVYEPTDVKEDYVVSYVGEEEKSTSVYQSRCLKEKDKYTVFFGGNHARMDIETTCREGGNLLVIKDSYANCFIPFLLPYYQDIVVIDPRYFYDSIDNIITSNAITDVLFLYNVNTFLGDNSIADVLTGE